MFSKKSITRKYLTAFILFIVLPVFVMGIVIYESYSKVLQKNYSERTSQIINQISVDIDNQTRSMSLTLAGLSQDDDFIDLLTKWNRIQDAESKLDLSKLINKRLTEVFISQSRLENIVIFMKDKGFYLYQNTFSQDEGLVRNSEWYGTTLNPKNKITILDSFASLVTGPGNINNKLYLSCSIAPDNPSVNSDVELIYFSMPTSVIDPFIRNSNGANSWDLLVLNSQGKIIAAQDSQLIGTFYHDIYKVDNVMNKNGRTFYETVNGKKSLVTVRSIPKTGWIVINQTEYDLLTGELTRIGKYVIFISVSIMILFVIFSLLFFRDLILPIKSLIREMRKVEKGNFETSVKITKPDEIGHLEKSFNKMVREIKQLIMERDLKEKEKNQAEIDALQSQINPHFISNTLSSIRFMAMLAKADNIKQITESFIKIVSATFGRDGKFTTIEREMELLQSYMSIMNFRHDNKYDVRFEVNDEILDLYILKMTLQPILENAILHGVSELETKGQISIKGVIRDEAVIFEIFDNGAGISEEKLGTLLNVDTERTNGFSRMGVRNVDRRIKYNFGEAYGLTFESVFGEYTKVTVLLPVIHENLEEIRDV